MRRFYLKRTSDESGVSGVGRVAEGVLLNNGWVITEWHSEHKEITTSESIAVFEKLHCHGGKSEIIWYDLDPYEEIKANVPKEAEETTPKEEARNTSTPANGSGNHPAEEAPERGKERSTQSPDAPEEA